MKMSLAPHAPCIFNTVVLALETIGNPSVAAPAAPPAITAFLRKDLAVAHLGGIAMTTGQKVIAVTLISIYFPCLATFAMVLKEGGIRDLAKSVVVLLLSFFIFGGLMAEIVNVFNI